MRGVRCPPTSSCDMVKFTGDPGCGIRTSKANEVKNEINEENIIKNSCAFGGDFEGERDMQCR